MADAAVLPDSPDPEMTHVPQYRDPDLQPLLLCEEAEHYRLGYEIGFYAKEDGEHALLTLYQTPTPRVHSSEHVSISQGISEGTP